MKINSYDATIEKMNDFDHNVEFNEIIFEGRKYTSNTQPTDNKINRLTLFWDDSIHSTAQNQNDAPAPIASSHKSHENNAYKKTHHYPFVNELKSNRSFPLPSQNQNNNDTTDNFNLLESPLNFLNLLPQTSPEDEFPDQAMYSETQDPQFDIDSTTPTQNNSEGSDSQFPILFSNDELSEIQDPLFVPNLLASNQATPILQVHETIQPPTSSFKIPKTRGNFTGTDVCKSCHATETPQWRQGPDGPRTLCNPCGLKYSIQPNATSKNLIQTISQIIPPSTFPNYFGTQNPQDHVAETQPIISIFPFPRTADMQFGNNNQLPVAAITSNQQLQTHNLQNEPRSIIIAAPKIRGRPPGKRQGFCDNCGTQRTVTDKKSGLPFWRRGPQGPNTLCNACGIQYAKKKKKTAQSSSPINISNDSNTS